MGTAVAFDWVVPGVVESMCASIVGCSRMDMLSRVYYLLHQSPRHQPSLLLRSRRVPPSYPFPSNVRASPFNLTLKPSRCRVPILQRAHPHSPRLQTLRSRHDAVTRWVSPNASFPSCTTLAAMCSQRSSSSPSSRAPHLHFAPSLRHLYPSAT